LGWTVAANKPEAKPCPRQDSRPIQGRGGCDPDPKGRMARASSPRRRIPALTQTQSRSVPLRQGWKPHRIGAGWIGLGVVSSGMMDGLSATRNRSWRSARRL